MWRDFRKNLANFKEKFKKIARILKIFLLKGQKMNVQLANLNQFLASHNVEFVIPAYQRNYAWQKKHCEQLLEDIITVSKDASKHHFLGTFTYILHPNT